MLLRRGGFVCVALICIMSHASADHKLILICVYIYAYTYIHIYLYVPYIHACICICIHTCIYIHIYRPQTDIRRRRVTSPLHPRCAHARSVGVTRLPPRVSYALLVRQKLVRRMITGAVDVCVCVRERTSLCVCVCACLRLYVCV